MKRNSKFLISVVAALTASTLLLTGCIYGITESNGGEKSYDLDAMSGINTGLNAEDAPTSQAELKKKFAAMSKIDEESNSITLITKEFLDDYWSGNRVEGTFLSLTTEEVLFIVQDSIELFYNGGYYQIILSGYKSGSLNIEEKVYTGPVRNQQENEKYVHEIILHRLRLLSSPEVFFWNPFESALKNVFYMPSFAENAKLFGFKSNEDFQKYLVFYFSGAMSSDPDMPDYFYINYEADHTIILISNRKREHIYPSLPVPKLFVICDLTSYEATKGAFSWTYLNENGQSTAMRADSAHPLQMQELLPQIKISPQKTLGAVTAVTFSFDSVPDEVSVRCWEISETDPDGGTQVKAGPYGCELSDKSAVYEVSATWLGEEGGTVSYCFRTVVDTYANLTTENGYNGCNIHVDLQSGRFYLSGSVVMSFAIGGTFERVGDDLLLYPQNSSTEVYVLQRDGDCFVSQSEEINMGLKKGLVFYADNDEFWDKLLTWTPPEGKEN